MAKHLLFISGVLESDVCNNFVVFIFYYECHSFISIYHENVHHEHMINLVTITNYDNSFVGALVKRLAAALSRLACHAFNAREESSFW